MIYLIVISLGIVLLLNFVLLEKDLASPSILFIGGFFFTAILAAAFNDVWCGFYSEYLYLLIVGGSISFLLGCLIVCVFSRKGNAYVKKIEPIILRNDNLLMLLLIQIVLACISYIVVRNNTISSDYVMAIGEFYLLNKSGEADIPSYFKVLQYFNMAGVYICIYVLMNNKICGYKDKILLYIPIIVGLMITLMQGTRNAFFMFFISAMIMYFILKNIVDSWQPNINILFLKKICLITVIGIGLFQMSYYITGRDDINYSFIDLLSSYLGAPIKNLDYFLLENHSSGKLLGEQTFLQWYKKLYDITHSSIFITRDLYEYRWLNNIGLGNVYTIYMPLFNDFGLLGAWGIVGIIGAFLQIFYYKIRFNMKNNISIDMYIIIYSYVGFSVFFSFFSNKFFEMTISIGFIYLFIALLIMKKLIFGKW